MISKYFEENGPVIDLSVNCEIKSSRQGYLKGFILFDDYSVLHFKEFLHDDEGILHKLRYSYHYQDSLSKIIFRYDNASHKPHHPTENTNT